ncbi:MAG: signal recognition particle-docking protein FtsY [Actinomycetota bacterium]
MTIAASTNEILLWAAGGGVVFGVGVILASRVIARRGAPGPVETIAPRGEVPVVPVSEAALVEVAPVETAVVEGPVVEAPVVEVAPVEAAPADAPVVEVPATPPSVRDRTSRTRGLFANAFSSIRGRGRIDEETWADLEELLLRADLGVGLVDGLIADLRVRATESRMTGVEDLIAALRESMTARLSGANRSLTIESPAGPAVWLFVGVNGVGKTTTIGKVATARVAEGASVVLAAGDTFRAAAAEQLQIWAERSGAGFVRGAEGADPASVIFDGIESAAAKNADLVLADTAGRLQNKTNLMEELRKVRRVADKARGTVTEVLLVVDATTGQNGLSQAREFAAATDVTGVVLTKLDGSAKGGIVFAIETELGIPVKLVGLGEGAHDLVTFNPGEFVSALFE